MAETPTPAPSRPPLEERAANALNAVMGGLVLLAVTVFLLLRFAATLWAAFAGDILKVAPLDILRAAVPGLWSGILGLLCLSLLVRLVRKAFRRAPGSVAED